MVVEACARKSEHIQYILHHQCKLLPSPSPPASATYLPKCLFNALNCNAQQLRQRTVLFSHRIYPPRLRRLWWLRRLGRLRGLCRGRSCTAFLVLHRAGWIPGGEGMIKVPPPAVLEWRELPHVTNLNVQAKKYQIDVLWPCDPSSHMAFLHQCGWHCFDFPPAQQQQLVEQKSSGAGWVGNQSETSTLRSQRSWWNLLSFKQTNKQTNQQTNKQTNKKTNKQTKTISPQRGMRSTYRITPYQVSFLNMYNLSTTQWCVVNMFHWIECCCKLTIIEICVKI